MRKSAFDAELCREILYRAILEKNVGKDGNK